MKHRNAERGYVLLIVLAAVAVLSVLAAFVHSQTESQLIVTTALKGQSVAASRATLAAQAYLATFRSKFPDLATYPSFSSYADAVAAGAGATLPDALTDYSPGAGIGNPALPLELSAGGGVQYCVDVWRLNRGNNVQPWTVLEVFGFYGYRKNAGLTSCTDVASSAVVVSQLEVQIEQATVNSSSPGSPGPGGGTGSAGGF
jgi:hypothetical protein